MKYYFQKYVIYGSISLNIFFLNYFKFFFNDLFKKKKEKKRFFNILNKLEKYYFSRKKQIN